MWCVGDRGRKDGSRGKGGLEEGRVPRTKCIRRSCKVRPVEPPLDL